MDSLILVINPGSTSKKLALYKGTEILSEARCESVGSSEFLVTLKVGQKKYQEPISKSEFDNATQWFIHKLKSAKLINSPEDLSGVGLRIVAPGSAFQAHQIINTSFIELLEKEQNLAPLHITPVLKEIQLIGNKYPGLRMVAISDSEFHRDIPDVTKYYGIGYDDSNKWDIKRFGYHGISMSSLARQLHSMCEVLPKKVIACHLGGGASITAILNGKSIDTSMGLTPLEGLLMNTRGGDLDDGALILLAKKSAMSFEDLEVYLSKKCGLLGVSGKTGDIRELLELEAQGDPRAHLALEMFIYRVRKYIGSYMMALEGLNVLVFSATIGERSGIMRQRILEGLGEFGFKLDDHKNFEDSTQARWIHESGSPIGIAVIPTDEMGEMAIQTQEVIDSL